MNINEVTDDFALNQLVSRIQCPFLFCSYSIVIISTGTNDALFQSLVLACEANSHNHVGNGNMNHGIVPLHAVSFLSVYLDPFLGWVRLICVFILSRETSQLPNSDLRTHFQSNLLPENMNPLTFLVSENYIYVQWWSSI